jgi:hypothetical protein
VKISPADEFALTSARSKPWGRMADNKSTGITARMSPTGFASTPSRRREAAKMEAGALALVQ